MEQKLYMVFDVESVGLHGEGFAVGWSLIDQFGTEKAFSLMGCSPTAASGNREGRKWVDENCAGLIPLLKFDSPKELRSAFWADWIFYKTQGALLCAECLWPVESRFMCGCVDDSPESRTWEGPYPFHEIASIMLAAGMNPMATYPREERELPAHNPLADARQSARLLITALKAIKQSQTPPPLPSH